MFLASAKEVGLKIELEQAESDDMRHHNEFTANASSKMISFGIIVTHLA